MNKDIDPRETSYAAKAPAAQGADLAGQAESRRRQQSSGGMFMAMAWGMGGRGPQASDTVFEPGIEVDIQSEIPSYNAYDDLIDSLQNGGQAVDLNDPEAVEALRQQSFGALVENFGINLNALEDDERASLEDRFNTSFDAALEQAREAGRTDSNFIIALTHMNYQNDNWMNDHPELLSQVRSGDVDGAVDSLRRYETPAGGFNRTFRSGGSIELASPVENMRVTSNFSHARLHPVHGGHRPHRGTDIGVGIGTDYHAPADGVVAYAGHSNGYGNVVIVSHGNGVYTMGAHLNNSNVRTGQQVGAGQHIADTGNTGTGTGAHLHFEVWITGSNGRIYAVDSRAALQPGVDLNDPQDRERLIAGGVLASGVTSRMDSRFTAPSFDV